MATGRLVKVRIRCNGTIRRAATVMWRIMNGLCNLGVRLLRVVRWKMTGKTIRLPVWVERSERVGIYFNTADYRNPVIRSVHGRGTVLGTGCRGIGCEPAVAGGEEG